MFGGVVEDACARAGLKTPTLSAAQRQMPIAKRVIIGGSVVGVIAGCLIGATSLLWLDLEAAERAKRAKELDTIFKVRGVRRAACGVRRAACGAANAAHWCVALGPCVYLEAISKHTR